MVDVSSTSARAHCCTNVVAPCLGTCIDVSRLGESRAVFGGIANSDPPEQAKDRTKISPPNFLTVNMHN